MTLRIARAELLSALSHVNRALGGRTVNPLLQQVRLTAGTETLELCVTCYTLTAAAKVAAANDEPFLALAPAQALADLLARLPDKEVTLSWHPRTNTLTVRGAQARLNLKGGEPTEYPETFFSGDYGIAVSGPRLAQALGRVLVAVERRAYGVEPRAGMNAVICSVAPEALTLAATDGSRLATEDVPLEPDPLVTETPEVLLPAAAATEFGRLAAGQETVGLVLEHSAAELQAGDLRLRAQLIAEPIVQWRSLLSVATPTSVTLDSGALERGLRLLGAFNPRLPLVTLSFREGVCELRLPDSETGEGMTTMASSWQGAPWALHLDYTKALAALGGVDGPVTLSCDERVNFVRLTAENVPSWKYLLATMRIETKGASNAAA
jgi:DNA polymerase III sliding clamp (beta) subunit (PCNA family)